MARLKSLHLLGLIIGVLLISVVSSHSEPAPNISVSPASHNFGTLSVNSLSEPLVITIFNTGSADLEIAELSIEGADELEFDVESDECSPETIPPFGSCTAEILFSPISDGEKSATLLIVPDSFDDEPLTPLSVFLTGSGTLYCSDVPEILKLSKTEGTYGDEITITGTDFCNEKGKIVFAMGDIEIPASDIISWKDDEIVISVPWGCKAGINKVRVITALDNEGNEESFKIIKPMPKITGLFPNSGQIDSEVEISGKRFGEKDEMSHVLFNDIKADIIDWNNDSITVTVPKMKLKKKGKIVSVEVKSRYGTSNDKKFKVLPAK